MIELETGARVDGTLVARRARLVLDSGAYCGEGGFFAQMAAMHAHGPYELENVHIESSLVYSNNQPSSSIRAPTAPQVCWALEQHMDELAEALGIDPVELRRRTLIEDGLGYRDRPGARADRDEGDARARGRADRRRPACPRTRRSGSRAAGGRASRRTRARTSSSTRTAPGTIVTGAQENGTGAVMAMPALRRRGAGHAPGGLLAALPGHRCSTMGHGLVRVADDVQQRSRGARRGGRGARPAARRRLRVRSRRRATTSSSRAARSASRARPRSRSRSPSSPPTGRSTERARARSRPRRPPRRKAASAASATSRSTRRS